MKKIFIIFLLFSIGCSNSRNTEISGISFEKVDFFSLMEEPLDAIPDSLIKNKKYINLSVDHKDLLFSEIDQIKIRKGKIYVLDKVTRLLAVFDTTGKGIQKVGDIGRAPGEYLNTTNFDVDAKGNIFLLDGRQDKLNFYDKDCHFVKSVKLPFEIDIIHSLKNNKLLLGLSSWNEMDNAGDKIVKANADNLEITEVYCQYDKNTDPNYWIGTYQFLETDEYIIYNRFLDNQVYLFSKEGTPCKSVVFDFGNKNVPQYAKQDIVSKEELYYHFCCLRNITIIGENYLLGYVWDEREAKIFLIDNLHHVLYWGKPSSFNILGKVIGCYENKIISYLDPGEYLNYYHNISLPAGVVEHLRNEGYSICIYEIDI